MYLVDTLISVPTKFEKKFDSIFNLLNSAEFWKEFFYLFYVKNVAKYIFNFM